MKRKLKILAASLIILFFLVRAVVLVLNSSYFQSRLKSFVIKVFEREMGGKLSFSDLNVSVLPSSLEAENLRIEFPDDRGELRVEYLKVVPVFFDARFDRLEISSIVLNGLTFSMAFKKGNETPIRLDVIHKKLAQTVRDLIDNFFIRHIRITDGNLIFSDTQRRLQIAHVQSEVYIQRHKRLHFYFNTSRVVIERQRQLPLVANFDFVMNAFHDGIVIDQFDLRSESVGAFDIHGNYRFKDLAKESFFDYKVAFNMTALADLFDWGTGYFGDVAADGRVIIMKNQKVMTEGRTTVKKGAIAGFLLHDVNAKFNVNGDRIKVDHARINVKDGVIEASATINLDDAMHYQIDGTVEKLQFADILRTFAVDQDHVFFDIDGPLFLKGTFIPFVMDLRSPQLVTRNFNLDVIEGNFPDPVFTFPQTTIALKSIINNNEMTFDNSRIDVGKGFVGVNGVLGFGSGKMHIDAVVNDLPLSTFNYFTQQGFRGRIQADVAVAGAYDDLTIDSNIDVSELTLNGFSVNEVTTKGRFKRRVLNLQDLQLRHGDTRIGIDHFHLNTKRKTLPFAGSFVFSALSNKTFVNSLPRRFKKLLDEIAFSSSGSGELSGNLLDFNSFAGYVGSKQTDLSIYGAQFEYGEFFARAIPGKLTLEKVVLLPLLADKNEDRGFFGEGVISQLSEIDFIAYAKEVELSDAKQDNSLTMNGEVKLSGNLENPRAKIFSSFTKIRTRSLKFDDVSLTGRVDKQVLSLEGGFVNQAVAFRFEYGFSGHNNYALKLSGDRFPFASLAKVVNFTDQIIGDMTFDVDLKGSIAKRTIYGQARLVDLRLLKTDPLLLENTILEFKGTEWRLPPFRISGRFFNFQGQGLKSTDDKLVLDASGNLEMRLFQELLQSVRFASGVAALNFKTIGTVDDAAVAGSVIMKDGKLLFLNLFPQFTDIEVDIGFTQENIIINRIFSRKGNGTIVAQGAVQLEKFVPQQFNLDMTLDRVKTRLVLPVIDSVDIINSGKLSISGDRIPFLLSGDIILDRVSNYSDLRLNRLITKGIEGYAIAGIRKKDHFVNFDIALKADRTIRIRNRLFDGIASSNVRVGGNELKPTLNGTISIPSGFITIRKKRFRIATGSINFNDVLSKPDINILAIARINRYKVYIRVSGQPSSPNFVGFDIEPKTTPDGTPLTTNDIATLISTGRLPEKSVTEGLTIAKATQVEGINLITNAVIGVIESEITDIITAVTIGLFDKFDVGFQVSKETATITPRITLGKTISDRVEWNTSLEFGANAVDSKIEYRVNPNMSLEGEVNNTPSLEQSDAIIEVGGDVKFKFEFDY